MRHAKAAVVDKGISALEPTNLRVVDKDANITVTAFPTKHALVSYGYRFDTPDRSIVISGDTSPAQETIDACHGCDLLIQKCVRWSG